MKRIFDVPTIKAHPELRHVLAHLYHAVHELAKGNNLTTLAELKAIEASLFFDDDQEEDFYRKEKRKMAKKPRKPKCGGKGK